MRESLFPASLTWSNLLNSLGKFTGSIALSIDLGFLCQPAAAEVTNSLTSLFSALPLLRVIVHTWLLHLSGLRRKLKTLF